MVTTHRKSTSYTKPWDLCTSSTRLGLDRNRTAACTTHICSHVRPSRRTYMDWRGKCNCSIDSCALVYFLAICFNHNQFPYIPTFIVIQGRIASLYITPDDIVRYTSFPAHATRTNRILANDQGLFSIGGRNIRHTLRRGIMKWSIR